MLLRARSAIRRKSFAEAIDALERGLTQFPDDVEIRDLLDTSRQEFERLTQKKQVEEVSQQARQLLDTKAHTDAINLLERTAARVSDPDLARLLDYARQEAASYRAGMQQASQQATQMLDSGQSAEALRFLETHAATYGKNADFQSFSIRPKNWQKTRSWRSRGFCAKWKTPASNSLRRNKPSGSDSPQLPGQAPADAEVLALAIEIDEAKKALERRRQEEAERIREAQQREAEAARAATAAGDAGTKLFPSAAEPLPPPRDQAPESRVQSSTGIGAPASGPAPTEWFQPATSHPPPILEQETLAEPEPAPKQKLSRKEKQKQKAAAPVEPPSERVVLFPKEDEELPLAPEPRKSKKLVLIAGAAVLVLIVAVVVGIKLVPRTPAEAYLKVIGTPAGASVIVDDKPESPGTDGLIKISPGPHAVRITAEGYEPKTESVVAEAGKTEPVDGNLQRLQPPRPPPQAQGTLAVQSSDFGADVFVDGQSSGVTGRDRKASLELDPGPHRIQLQKSGYRDSNEIPVKIIAKQQVSVKFPPLTEIVSKTFLVIDSNPRGSSVRVDDKAAGNIESGPLRVKVTPGSFHNIQVTKEGYEPWKNDRVTVKRK